jgi:hypothetical protein
MYSKQRLEKLPHMAYLETFASQVWPLQWAM